MTPERTIETPELDARIDANQRKLAAKIRPTYTISSSADRARPVRWWRGAWLRQATPPYCCSRPVEPMTCQASGNRVNGPPISGRNAIGVFRLAQPITQRPPAPAPLHRITARYETVLSLGAVN
jgi:hypothetical protein